MMTIRAALAAVLALGILPLVTPFTSEAQQSEKVHHVGHLSASLAPPECRTEARDEAFLKGLRDLGYVRGKNIVIERRCYMTGDELRKILSEFIRLKVDVIFVASPEVALAAKNATKEIPIVCGSCGDPVDNGLVASLARPGGNVTGLASLSAELIGKRVELLKEAVPGLSRVAVLVFPSNPGFRLTLRALEATGRALGIEMQRVEVRNVRDLEKAFRSAAAGGAGAVLLQDDPLAFAARTQIADLALKHRLPLVAGQPQNAEAGTLMVYGPERIDLFRRAAGYVDKILKGAKPADLPVEQPTKFELVINLKTAKALGLTIPQSLLVRADEIIQ